MDININKLKFNKIYKNEDNEYFILNSNGLYVYKELYKDWVVSSITYNEVRNMKFKEAEDKEIKWKRVPEWTKVQVEGENGEWQNAYLIAVNEDNCSPYIVTFRDPFTFTSGCYVAYKKIRLHESVLPKMNWIS